ncbi:hypothetical protein [Paraburkholderia bryophila]|uniref:TubC N-terminal docking domain-containing protein n=1 Tax=Paraburkholderia bryophila TaxID=420952 RepID=A0A7Y9WNW8_9BURK|nr:hypothetical protein [Paraburkholderia bryophila]NYH23957.1 hypothetical protein [Paraburkholderia bryophila]
MNTNARDLLGMANAAGVSVSLEGGIVRLRGPAAAIAATKPKLAPFKSEIVAYLRAAAKDADKPPADHALMLRDESNGLYLPWGPYMSADDVRRLRAVLADVIAELSRLEGWAHVDLDDITSRATRAPLSALLPDVRYFGERLAAARDEAAARAALAARTWKYDPRVR